MKNVIGPMIFHLRYCMTYHRLNFNIVIFFFLFGYQKKAQSIRRTKMEEKRLRLVMEIFFLMLEGKI